MKKPNLFIIGAPKCGTSSLYTYLKNHPQIFMSRVKEPNYFNTDKKHWFFKDRKDYEKLFLNAPDTARYLGEASVWYLYSRVAVLNILSYNPDSKFIVMLRNPIEMAPSLHKQHLYTREELTASFKEAWNLQDKRSNGEEIPKHCKNVSRLLYGPVCKLGDQLERLFNTCKRENILVLFLEDLKNDPAAVMNDVNSFLEIKNWLPASFPVVNPAEKSISNSFQQFIINTIKLKEKLHLKASFGILTKLIKINTKNDAWSIDHKMKEELLDYFQEDISKIEDLMDVNLSHWREI